MTDILSVLFWNVNRRNLGSLVQKAISIYTPDLLILAESAAEPKSLARALSDTITGSYSYVRTPSRASRPLQIFTRMPRDRVSYIMESGDLTGLRVKPVMGREIALCGIHLRSKMHTRDADQALLATRLRDEVDAIERRVGHQRTVLVGDFNMNPFEAGVIGSEALHALPVQRVVKRGHRVVSGKARDFFYNPMWRFFDDHGASPGGTYYRSDGSALCYFWNIFDQVLLRPGLIPEFPDDGIEVLSSIGGDEDLLTPSRIPDSKNYSDHLPLLLRLCQDRSDENATT